MNKIKITVHSKEVIFNEYAIYKDIFGAVDTNNADTQVRHSEYIEQDDISNFDVYKSIQND